MAINALPNQLTLNQLQRAMMALDVNHDGKISGNEIGFPPSQIQQLNAGVAGDAVDLSRAAQTLNAGLTTISFSGNYRAAREAAQSLDANFNGTIDASEVTFSDGLKQEITGSTTKPVSVQDLANAFWQGTVKFGRDLRQY
jgi:putative methionine-R-sulfoxide reductase with GAF domain